jgi:hypothetical protein
MQYPNIGMNAMAAPFSANVLISGMPGLNQGSMIPMTSGDEGGLARGVVGRGGRGRQVTHERGDARRERHERRERRGARRAHGGRRLAERAHKRRLQLRRKGAQRGPAVAQQAPERAEDGGLDAPRPLVRRRAESLSRC